jgi:hypothetical protein
MTTLMRHFGSTLPITNHAQVRMRQRGFRGSDIELVLAHGTESNEAVVLTKSDVECAVRRLKRQIQALERLNGTAIVTAGEVVQTVYRPRKRKMRKFLDTSRGSSHSSRWSA